MLPFYLFGAALQNYLEATTAAGASTGAAHTYQAGKLLRDNSFAGGYKRWDGIDRTWVNLTPVTVSNRLYGFDSGLPNATSVPVHDRSN